MAQQFDPYKYGQFDTRVGTSDPTIINALIQAAGGMKFGESAPQAQNAINDLLGKMQNGPGISAGQFQQSESILANLLQRFGNPDISQQVSAPGADPFQVFTSDPVVNTGGGIPAGPPMGGTPGGGTGTTPPPFSTDPNKPLSTPDTPVNQGTAPADINPFISDTSKQQQDILNNSISQSQNVAGQDLAQMRGIIGPYIQEQFKAFTDPNGPEYQSTIGQLNNVGMADSGAFPQALASRLAPLISQGAFDLGKGTLLPSFLNQQGMVDKGLSVQSNLGLDPLQRFVEMQNWNMQAQEAEKLASQGANAQFGSGIGGLLGGGLGAWAGGAMGGVPGAMIGATLGSQGGNAAGGGISWICGHLKRSGLATESEVEAVHAKLRPTIFKHPIHWLHYLYAAPRLIVLATLANLDWSAVKPVLIDAVIAAPDSEEAWKIYRNECKRLCDLVAPELWQLEEPCSAAI